MTINDKRKEKGLEYSDIPIGSFFVVVDTYSEVDDIYFKRDVDDVFSFVDPMRQYKEDDFCEDRLLIVQIDEVTIK